MIAAASWTFGQACPHRPYQALRRESRSRGLRVALDRGGATTLSVSTSEAVSPTNGAHVCAVVAVVDDVRPLR